MNIKYYKETDSLYIEMSKKDSSETTEVSAGVNIDFNQDGNIVGINIDNASKKTEFKRVDYLQFTHINAKNLSVKYW